MKLLFVGILIIGTFNANAAQIVQKSIDSLGECKLQRTDNALVKIDRYSLNIKYKILELNINTQEINSLKNYMRALLIDNPIESITTTLKYKTDYLSFSSNGKDSAYDLCQKVRNELEKIN
ncbi:MAG: hypothetical protein ACOYL6_08655 [Bacteriovoracaceae bacterium]